MFLKRSQLFAGFVFLVVVLAFAGQATAQKKHVMGSKMTRAEALAFAVSAAPPEIGRHATVMDATNMSKPKQLRAGSNGWICYAMMLGNNKEAMCLDKQWQNWAEAYIGKTEPKIEGTGIAYMLRGDNGASNTDPYATGPTADNQWVKTPAHIMVLYSDPRMLDSYPTDPKTGGPWVMWKGTPYAHVMVPVSPTKPATMSK